MKLLAWVFVGSLVLYSTSGFSAPIYRAGEEVHPSRSVLHGEISAGYILSSHRLEYVTEEDSSSRLRGAEIRALWSPLSWLSVGAEFDKLGKEKLSPFVEKYYVNRAAGIVKLTLSPNTTPRFYLIGGYGRSKHKLQYNASDFRVRLYPPVTKGWTYWMVGLGLEADVWKECFVGLEGSLIHYNGTQLTELFKTVSRLETDVRLRLGIRF